MSISEKQKLIGNINTGKKQNLTGTHNVGDFKSESDMVQYVAFISNGVLIVRNRTS